MAEIKTERGNYILLKILKRSEYINRLNKTILYGFVAKVKSKDDNKIYAMKRIDLSLVENKGKKKYYENELDIIKRFDLKNENVYRPRIVSCFKEKNIIYIITEYIDGVSLLDLYEWNEKNKIEIEEKKIEKIFDQCLRGLNYIHKKGIIHRSIKPDNIVIDSNDRVKIINFKYAIEKSKNDNAKVKIGIYTAPEISNGAYNEKVDVYSLGIVFNLLMYFKDKLPDDKGSYSDNLFQRIKNMLKERGTSRPSSEEIYLEFKNNYYNLMRACLKCFVFLLQNELLKAEFLGVKENEKIMDLAKKRTDIGKLSKEFEEEFFDNGFSLNDISPTNFTYFLLSKIQNKNLLNYISYQLKLIKFCPKCHGKDKDEKIEHYIVKINTEQIANAKENIKDIFQQFNKNKKTNSFYECCFNKDCKIEKKMEITTKYFKLPKYLIIFIEKGHKFSEVNSNNLDNFELEIEEGSEKKYCYQLHSIITKENENYDYYNRDKYEFTKNEELETTISLQEILKNDIIGLYYCQKDNNNNDEKQNPPSTRASSVINGNENPQNIQNDQIQNNSINNNQNINGQPVKMNNFMMNNPGNNNSNSNQFNNFYNNTNNNFQFNNQNGKVNNMNNNFIFNNQNNNNNNQNNTNNNYGQAQLSKNIHADKKVRK